MPGTFADFEAGMIDFIFPPLGRYTGTDLIAKWAYRAI
jgi:hypothetical protein